MNRFSRCKTIAFILSHHMNIQWFMDLKSNVYYVKQYLQHIEINNHLCWI